MAQQHVTIKGGQIGGAFNRWTSAWSILLSKEIPDVKFSSESSTGSPENVRAVGSGSAGTGLVFASDLFNAYRGLDQYKKPQTQVGAMTYVFASVAHFIVPANSDFKTIQDIKGKRVSLGGPGSGSAVNLTLLLKQMGLWDGFKPVYLGRKSPEALRNGEIAAYNWHPGLGNAMIRNTATMMKVRFIDLDEPARKSGFYDKYPYFGKMTIPAGLYSDVNVATSTFGTGRAQRPLRRPGLPDPQDPLLRQRPRVHARRGREGLGGRHDQGERVRFHHGAAAPRCRALLEGTGREHSREAQ
jgi:TRAP transporter TAXI family solute receptor